MKIAQVILSNSWGEVSPEAFERGIGGREGALIRLATEWAKLGHEVTNFVGIDKAKRFEENKLGQHTDWKSFPGFHEYAPIKLCKPMLRSFPYDAVVAWECPEIYNDPDIIEQQQVRLVHMQVAHMADHVPAEEFSTGVVALSEWAKDFLVHSGLDDSKVKMYVRPNGVDINKYPLQKDFGKRPKKNPVFVYSSSPDRGLWHILKMWPEIRKRFGKGSRLFVGYGVRNFTDQIRWMHSRVGEMSLEIERLMTQSGVIDIGKIGQSQLAKLQLNADIWLYPADTIQATETGCITAIENMAAGNPCIMSDVDCLKDEFSGSAYIHELPFNQEQWLDTIRFLLSSDTAYESMAKQGRMFAQDRDWSKIAPKWIQLFKENRNGGN